MDGGVSTALRDELGARLGYHQGSTGTWTGTCHQCGAQAMASSVSWTCPTCGTMTLEGALALSGIDGDGWPEEPDVPGSQKPEDIPTNGFPEVAESAIRSISDSLQVHSDLSALSALASASAAIADRVDLEIRDGQREPLALYCAGIANPGERKSGVFNRSTQALYEWQRNRARTEEPRRRAALDRVDALQARLASIKKSASKDPAALDELEEARNKLDAAEREVPPSCSLILDDVTPEKLAMELAAQGGRGAIFSAEGDVLRIFAGRYGNGDPRADLLKKAINGEATKVSRVGRATVWLPRPIMTVGLMFQPSVLGSLENRESLEGEGIFARFLFAQPDSALGSRLTGRDIPRPDRAAEARFHQALTRLLDVPPADVVHNEPVPHVLRLTEEAADALFGWEAEIESMLAAGGVLRPISGWGGKLFGHTCRIACILELLARADHGEELPGGPIPHGSAEGAVAIARALVTHALRVLGDLGVDAHASDLDYIWRKCIELDANPPADDDLTLATLRRATQGRRSIQGAGDIERLVNELLDRGCVRLSPQAPTGGRPRAERIEVHPAFRKSNAESAESPPATEAPAPATPELDELLDMEVGS